MFCLEAFLKSVKPELEEPEASAADILRRYLSKNLSKIPNIWIKGLSPRKTKKGRKSDTVCFATKERIYYVAYCFDYVHYYMCSRHMGNKTSSLTTQMWQIREGFK